MVSVFKLIQWIGAAVLAIGFMIMLSIGASSLH